MSKIIDFMTGIGERRAERHLAVLRKDFPELFEFTTNMAAVDVKEKPGARVNQVRSLKLQTNSVSR
jgi:hypothetical protein